MDTISGEDFPQDSDNQHHSQDSGNHPRSPAETRSNTWTVRSRVGFCDDLFLDCIHHSLNADTRQYYEYWRARLNLWATDVRVFNKTFLEPTLDKWLKHSSRKLQRDTLYILLSGLEEHLTHVVKPFYTSKMLHQTRALDILRAPKSGLEKIMGVLHFFARMNIAQREDEATFNDRVLDYRGEMADPQLEANIYQDILARFPRILPSEPLTSVVGAIYEADPQYLRRLRDEVPQSTGELHRHLTNLTSFRHWRMLYERQIKLNHLSLLDRQTPQFKLPWDNSRDRHGISVLSFSCCVSDIVHNGDGQYPEPPTPFDGEKTTVCPICLEIFPVEEFQGEKWKAHVGCDIKPYACLFFSCVEDHNASFSDIDEWKKHMHRLHHLNWIEDLHNNSLWQCPICDLVSPLEFGSDEIATEALLIHMEVSHSIGKDDTTRDLAEISHLITYRHLDICPICKASYPGVCDGPPLLKSSELMIEREPWSDDEDSEPKYIWRETLAADNPATRAVEDCIAGHLKDMALRSFKYFVQAANRQNEELPVYHAESSDGESCDGES